MHIKRLFADADLSEKSSDDTNDTNDDCDDDDDDDDDDDEFEDANRDERCSDNGRLRSHAMPLDNVATASA